MQELSILCYTFGMPLGNMKQHNQIQYDSRHHCNVALKCVQNTHTAKANILLFSLNDSTISFATRSSLLYLPDMLKMFKTVILNMLLWL